MQFEPYINDLLDPKIKSFEDLTNHFDLVERLQKSFYFKFESEEDIISNASLPLTEISVELFEKALEELNCNNNKTGSGNKKFNKFNLKYATRISRKAVISPYCFILALIYIKRLKQINPTYVKSQSACDLFLISLIVSSKFLFDVNTDEEIFNGEWATISGIDIETLNQMEIDFLFKLNWNAYVSPLEFMNEWINIENLVIKNECKKRSFQFITYNEIKIMFDDKVYQQLVSNFLRFISKFIFIASFTYSSAIFALVLLSKSSMIQNSLQMQSSQQLINQTYEEYYHPTHHSDEQSEDDDQLLNGEELSIEKLETELNSKTLNLNKLNNLNLNELNNRLNILNRDSVLIQDLTIDIYYIQQISDTQKCKSDSFNQFIKMLSKLEISKNENHSDYSLKRELNRQPTVSKLFLEYKVY